MKKKFTITTYILIPLIISSCTLFIMLKSSRIFFDYSQPSVMGLQLVFLFGTVMLSLLIFGIECIIIKILSIKYEFFKDINTDLYK